MTHVDIRDILALAWDYPLYTGGLALMFTPPMFRVIVYFSPLLICTALCAVALISVGQQIEAAREREIAGWNAKFLGGESLSARPGSASGRRNISAGEDNWLKLVQGLEPTGRRNISPGEDSWLKLVQGLEPAVSASNDETERSNWMSNATKEEGLKKHAYRVNEGRMQFLDDQDLLDRQIEAFREYERKFREKTRVKPTAAAFTATAAASNAGAAPGISSSPSAGITSAPAERKSNCDMPARKIPAMVLYNLRTGGTGLATMKGTGAGAAELSSWAAGAPAAATVSQEAIVAEGLYYGRFDKFPRNDNVLESSSGKQRRNEPPLPLSKKKPSSVFERDTIARTPARTPAAEMQASPFATVKNLNHNAPVKNVVWPHSIKPDNRLEGELAGFTSMAFGGKDKNSLKTSIYAPQGPAINSSSVNPPAKRFKESHKAPTWENRKSVFAPRSPVNNSTRVASPAKHSEDRSLNRASTYNSTLRSGNAVIYDADSERRAVSLRRKGYGSVHWK